MTERRSYLLVPAIAAGLACVLSAAHCRAADNFPGGGVVARSSDLDGDGIPEIILENDLVSVELFTGEGPDEEAPTFLGKLWPGRSDRKPPRYGTRFVGAGWIRNIVFKPTGRRWFVNTTYGREYWDGIPEEFGVAVRMKEVAPNEYDALKIGIGVCLGTGLCLRGSLQLLDPGTWRSQVRETAGGGRAVTFEHTVKTELGFAYVYTKTLRLDPGSAQLVVIRSLRNIGSKPIRTTWYSHAFWGQATDGNGYDRACWSTIPIASRLAGPGDYTPVNTDACHVITPEEGTYWGPICSDLIRGNWYASGNSDTGDIFSSEFPPDRVAWYRIWTHTKTYSCEPFVCIDLEAGEEDTWVVSRTCGSGLDAVRAVRPGGMFDWKVDSGVGGAAGGSVRVSFLPREPLTACALEAAFGTAAADGNGEVHLQEAPPAADASLTCTPVQPLVMAFPLPLGTVPSAMDLRVTGRTASGGEFAETLQAALAAPAELGSAAWKGDAGQAPALLIAPLKRDSAKGSVTPDRAGDFLRTYLREAGFSVRLLDARRVLTSDDLAGVHVVAFAGAGRIAAGSVRALEAFAEAGGGVLLTGALSLRPFEFSDLLPVASVVSSVTIDVPAPRDGTEEFLQASDLRYHMMRTADHPIVEGLPFYPYVHQNVARLQVVEPRPGAEVLLRYAAPAGISPEVDSPALVVHEYGQGRVAVLTCPVDWGSPAYWVTWTRLGEFHRKLFAQLALWAAGVPME